LQADVQWVVGQGRDWGSGHVVGNGVTTTTNGSEDDHNSDDNADNSSNTKTSSERDINDLLLVAAVHSKESWVADADTNSAVGGRISFVLASAVAAALIGARLRNVLHEDLAGRIEIGSAVHVAHTRARNDRHVRAQRFGGAPRAENAECAGGGVAALAVGDTSQGSAVHRLRNRSVASSTTVHGRAIRVSDTGADSRGWGAHTVARAVEAIVEARSASTSKAAGGVAAVLCVHVGTWVSAGAGARGEVA